VNQPTFTFTVIMIVLWILSVVLLAVSLVVICGNLWIALGGLFEKREKSESLIPFVGGVMGMIILPVNGARFFWWAPLTLDLGCGLLLASVIIEQLKKMIRG